MRILPPVALSLVLAASTGGWLAASPARSRPQSPPPLDRAALAAAVKTEFLHAWDGYRRLAWGHDELNPLSHTVHDWYPPAVLYMTPVDALDTMLVMGLTDQAKDAESEILDHLSFDQDVSAQVFEITIRELGGLLSAYQMTGEPRLLALAQDLGHRLLPAFNSPTGMPYRFVNLRTGQTRGNISNPAEIGTLLLEFGTLAKLTHNDVYYDKAKAALVGVFSRRAKATGLVGEGINVETGAWTNPTSHVGGGIDSYYEYLFKCARLFGDADCASMAKETLTAVNKYLADDRDGLWYGEANMDTGKRTATVYGALQAFFPTVLALSGDLSRARALQASNFKMWTLYGIEPEELDYRTMGVLLPGYQLRPEIVESAYYLLHYTDDPQYLRMGQTFFDDIKKYCRTDDGYTVLKSVVTHEQGDRMQSFFLAETLKYLYLIFAPPDALDFDHVTFNTEAHPLKRTW